MLLSKQSIQPAVCVFPGKKGDEDPAVSRAAAEAREFLTKHPFPAELPEDGALEDACV
jgi:hypothetical protein